MKCRVIITDSQNEVIIYTDKITPLTKEIERLCDQERAELIGYSDNEIIILEPYEISCFISEGDRVYALVNDKKLRIRSRLYTLEQEYSKHFVRINQSCLANISMIKRFNVSLWGALEVHFKNGYKDYVSRRRVKAVKERMGVK